MNLGDFSHKKSLSKINSDVTLQYLQHCGPIEMPASKGCARVMQQHLSLAVEEEMEVVLEVEEGEEEESRYQSLQRYFG